MIDIDIDIDIVYIYNYHYLYQHIQYTSMFSMPLKAMLRLQLQALRWFASLAPWARPRRTLPSSWRASRPPWGSWRLIPGDMASILARSSWCDEAYGYIINNDMYMFAYTYIYYIYTVYVYTDVYRCMVIWLSCGEVMLHAWLHYVLFYIKHPLFKKQEAALDLLGTASDPPGVWLSGPDPLDVAIRRIFITLKLATKLVPRGERFDGLLQIAVGIPVSGCFRFYC